MIEQLPLEERWKRVCVSNMELRGGLRDVMTLCDFVLKDEKEYSNIKCFAIDIQAIVRGALK